MKDIKLWYAYNEADEVIKIEEVKEDEKYHCPCCGENVYPKAINSDKVTSHFCHESGKSCSINGGENFIHKFVKEVTFKKGEIIEVNTGEGIKKYVIAEVILEKTYNTTLGDYRPDITLITECGERIFVEICNTNKKSFKKYYCKWLDLGSMVIELKVEDLINNNFEIDVLKPIFPTFEVFESSDWKALTGHSVTYKYHQEFLIQLYNAVYKWKKGVGDLEDVAIILLDRVAFYDDDLDKIVSKWICEGIDKEVILEAVDEEYYFREDFEGIRDAQYNKEKAIKKKVNDIKKQEEKEREKLRRLREQRKDIEICCQRVDELKKSNGFELINSKPCSEMTTEEIDKVYHFIYKIITYENEDVNKMLYNDLAPIWEEVQKYEVKYYQEYISKNQNKLTINEELNEVCENIEDMLKEKKKKDKTYENQTSFIIKPIEKIFDIRKFNNESYIYLDDNGFTEPVKEKLGKLTHFYNNKSILNFYELCDIIAEIRYIKIKNRKNLSFDDEEIKGIVKIHKKHFPNKDLKEFIRNYYLNAEYYMKDKELLLKGIEGIISKWKSLLENK